MQHFVSERERITETIDYHDFHSTIVQKLLSEVNGVQFKYRRNPRYLTSIKTFLVKLNDTKEQINFKATLPYIGFFHTYLSTLSNAFSGSKTSPTRYSGSLSSQSWTNKLTKWILIAQFCGQFGLFGQAFGHTLERLPAMCFELYKYNAGANTSP